MEPKNCCCCEDGMVGEVNGAADCGDGEERLELLL
jgi:hypothetical protein